MGRPLGRLASFAPALLGVACVSGCACLCVGVCVSLLTACLCSYTTSIKCFINLSIKARFSPALRLCPASAHAMCVPAQCATLGPLGIAQPLPTEAWLLLPPQEPPNVHALPRRAWGLSCLCVICVYVDQYLIVCVALLQTMYA